MQLCMRKDKKCECSVRILSLHMMHAKVDEIHVHFQRKKKVLLLLLFFFVLLGSHQMLSEVMATEAEWCSWQITVNCLKPT